MKVTLTARAVTELGAELLVIPITQRKGEGVKLPAGIAPLDRALGRIISRVLASGDFRARSGESLLLYPPDESIATRVLLLGLGSDRAIGAEELRSCAGSSVRNASTRRARTVHIVVPSLRRVRARQSAQALAEGAVLGAYRADLYRSPGEDPAPPVERTTLAYARSNDVAAARAGATRGVIIGESQNLARQLTNEPGSTLPPAELAASARRMARSTGLRCKVLGVAELERRKMGAILAVGQGSSNSPRVIILEHEPAQRSKRSRPTLCLVGKGITFDSGGISIKPAASMHEMKDDMGGAAAVIGAMRAAALLKLPARVVAVIASAENLPSGTAYRPGDVVHSMSGKTIEILNTDAEGRVVLADALHFARTEYAPEAMVDMATLTGACKVALGPWASGLFGTRQRLVERVRSAGEAAGEPMWPLPLHQAHRKAVQSQIADLRNAAGRDAGASTAAAFLEAFVGDTPWVHIDIAGTVWTDKATPVQPPGATGVGVRTLVELIDGWKGSPAV